MSDQLNLENAHLRMRVTPLGGMVLSLDSLDHHMPVLRAGNGHLPGDGALFPMLPLANRVRDNRFTLRGQVISLPESPVDRDYFLHGDGWLQRWKVVTAEAASCQLMLRSRHPCGFDYQAVLTYTLDGDALKMTLAMAHHGDSPMLYGAGFHPFFHFTAHSQAQFSASGYWPEGEGHLPLAWQDTLPPHADFSHAQPGTDDWLNVGYSGWSGQATIWHPAMTVTLTASTPWLMLFRQPGESFLCLEPQTHPVNAHQMPGQPGLRMLSKGEVLTFCAQIAVGPSPEPD